MYRENEEQLNQTCWGVWNGPMYHRISMVHWAIYYMLIWLMLLTGCGRQDKENLFSEFRLEQRNLLISKQLHFDRSMDLAYAKEFAVDYDKQGYALVTVADGSQYLIVPQDQEVPEDLQEGVVVVKQPLTNIYLVASAAMDMVCELDALPSIRFSGQKPDGWYIEEARQAMERGDLIYAGKYSMPDYELIVSEGCSLAIENNMISHSPEVIEKLQSFGIPVFVDLSSYEEHPLGRVEWIKFYGLLFQKEKEAEEMFLAQEKILDQILQDVPSKKTVAFFYITTNGSVNVRRSSDYVPKMIELAGGIYLPEYPDSEQSNRSTMNMQMEEFYKVAKDADYLIYNSTIDGELDSVSTLLQKERMLQDFKAVQNGNVWCTKKDMYQQSMSAGKMMEDLHAVLSGKTEGMHYLYLLK